MHRILTIARKRAVIGLFTKHNGLKVEEKGGNSMANKMTTCKACGAETAKSAKACPRARRMSRSN